jgi:CTP:molybdopterin cytidylyltransferase MocA
LKISCRGSKRNARRESPHNHDDEYLIAAARYNGGLGVPAVFSSMFFPHLLAVNEDHGARRILERNAEQVAPVDFPEGGLDLDTPEDLKLVNPF